MISAHIRYSSVADCHCKLSLSFPTTCFCIFVHMLLACDFSYIPKWTAYLQAIWSFMPSLSPMASLPYLPISAQRPYPPVSHAILQPSISTLQPVMPSPQPQRPKPPVLHAFLQPYIPPVSHAILQPSISTLQPLMPSTTPASLTSSPSCLSSGIHPCCPVTHAHPQPSIPTLQSLMKCPPSAPASLPSSPLQPTSTLHSRSSATLPSSPYCPPSALHVQFKTPINKKINI